MKKLYVILFILLISITQTYAFTWDNCIEKYQKAKKFIEHTKLSYTYLKGTRSCLVKFKDFLIQNPDPQFTVEAMSDNIVMLDNYIEDLIPKYYFPKNHLETIPKYLKLNSNMPILNKEYIYFKKLNNCNGIHAQNKIYTAKHCKVKNAKNIRFDLDYLESSINSDLEISNINLEELGTFKYFSMSKEGMFYNVLLKENNCKFYKAQNKPLGRNITLDLTDLNKKDEIRSTCLAIPSNSGGGVFQKGKLVGIISKTVFNKNEFLYSVIEPILPMQNTNSSHLGELDKTIGQ